MNRFSMRKRVIVGFGFIIVLLILVSVAAIQGLYDMQAAQQRIYQQDFKNVIDMKNIRSLHEMIRTNLMNIILNTSHANDSLIMDNIQKAGKESEVSLKRLILRNSNYPDRLSKLRQFEYIQTRFNGLRETQTVPLLRLGKMDEAKTIILGIQTSRNNEMQKISDELMNSFDANARFSVENSEKTGARTMLLLRAGALVSVLASVAMAVLIVLNLRKMSEKINEGINVLASSASEITASTTQVAAGSAETAAAITQTTATIEEVKQTSDMSVKKAKYVAGIADKTVEVSGQGKKSMDESLAAMQRIREQMESIAQSIMRLSGQSKDIGVIIATVNDLAEQSNLLAVNAAIEAAKAGEQGKGFAVVAQEVKSMAAQSKQATAKVNAILTDIQTATGSAVLSAEQGSKVVEEGVEYSREASLAIVSLTDSIAESAEAAAQIMSSAQQQLIGMDQVALAMQNINQASMQNVTSTKQAEIAAKDLHDLGQKLKAVIAQYG